MTVTRSFSLSLTDTSLRMYMPQTAPAVSCTNVTVVVAVQQYTSVAAMQV